MWLLSKQIQLYWTVSERFHLFLYYSLPSLHSIRFLLLTDWSLILDYLFTFLFRLFRGYLPSVLLSFLLIPFFLFSLKIYKVLNSFFLFFILYLWFFDHSLSLSLSLFLFYHLYSTNYNPCFPIVCLCFFFFFFFFFFIIHSISM
jgi:hypothetical protein